jgi:hypothetical protein
MFEPSGNKSDPRHAAAETAVQAVSGAITPEGAQGRLSAALTPLLPGLRLLVAKEHAREIRSFTNAQRIDIAVEVHLAGGEVLTVATPVRP